jgi:Leu/Phe-tRNA-protein transferase
MFSKVSNASKVAFISLAAPRRQLQAIGLSSVQSAFRKFRL